MEDRRINIKELLYRILCSWRAIVIAMLIGALLMNGLAFLRANSNYQAAARSKDETAAQKTQADYEDLLTDKQIARVQALVAYTRGCQANCQALADYTQTSIRYHIDPKCVPTVELLYVIESSRENSPIIVDHSYSEDIMMGFDSVINSDDVCHKMADAINGPEDEVYYRELLESVHEGNSLSIKVIADSQESCEKLADVIENAVNEQVSAFQKTYGSFTVSLVNRTYTENSNPDFLTEQMNIVKSLKDLTSYISENPSGLSVNEEAYYQFLISNHLDEDSETQNDDFARPGFLYPKHALLGAVAGLFVVCFWLGLKALLSGVLLSPVDCGEKVVAVLPIRTKKHGIPASIDRWLVKLFYRKETSFSEDNRLSMVTATARAAMEKADMKRILISSTCTDEDIQRIKSTICQMLANQTTQITVAGSALEDPDALTDLSGSDGVIFVERTGTSNCYDISAQNTVCKEYSVPIIGYVILR